ncbi:hypothetical protein PR048_019593 [Dryococelus australis]|uniref:Uncharacterized protein n=1 Tax=Dryococelus australis TaxID=614101 RepID=A0ABQ9H3W4_9NEOP|nr:hypothetical protein PR048_019593 [Dryococelus australis]
MKLAEFTKTVGYWKFEIFFILDFGTISYLFAFQNVTPDPTKQCGPYAPNATEVALKKLNSPNIITPRVDAWNHDTIGMVAIDMEGKIAAGTSTNGASHKIPG